MNDDKEWRTQIYIDQSIQQNKYVIKAMKILRLNENDVGNSSKNRIELNKTKQKRAENKTRQTKRIQ